MTVGILNDIFVKLSMLHVRMKQESPAFPRVSLIRAACNRSILVTRNFERQHNYLRNTLSGLGFGLIYLPAIVSVTIYFEKYRSLATGIAVCGSGLGTVMFAPFINHLIYYYGGYKYAMLILSAIVLNCIIFGVMFRPLEPVKSKECIPLKVFQLN